MRHVIVLGSAPLDRIERGGRSVVKAGGVVTYAGLTYRRHGLAVTVVANVAGADRPCFGELERAGIHVVWGATPHTTRFVNRVRGAARRQEMPTAARPLAPADVPREVEADFVHLGPLHPEDLTEDVLAGVTASGKPVGLDVQGYTRRRVGQRIVPGVAGPVEQALTAATFVKAEAAELALLLEHFGTDRTAFMQRFRVRELLVTEGPRGGYVVEAGGQTARYAAVDVAHVVDPTGAGDVFFAAYLVARRQRGLVPGAAAMYAAEVAAQHVAGRYLATDRLRCPGTVRF